MADTLDNIKLLYEQIENKKAFRASVAQEFGLRTSSVRTNWFSSWEIPEYYGVQTRLVSFMQNYIANQNHVSI